MFVEDFLRENSERVLELAKGLSGNVAAVQASTEAVQACEKRIRENVQAQVDGDAVQPLDAAAVFEVEFQTAMAKQNKAQSDVFVRFVSETVQTATTSNEVEMTVVQTETQNVSLSDILRTLSCASESKAFSAWCFLFGHIAYLPRMTLNPSPVKNYVDMMLIAQ